MYKMFSYNSINSKESDKSDKSCCNKILSIGLGILIIGLVISPIIACSTLMDQTYGPIKEKKGWNEKPCVVTDSTLVHFNPEYKILIDYCCDNRCKDDLLPYKGDYTLEEATLLLNTTYLEGNFIVGHQNKGYLTISMDRVKKIRSRSSYNYRMCSGLMITYIIVLVLFFYGKYNLL